MLNPPVRANDLVSEDVEAQIEARRPGWPVERVMGVLGFIGGVLAMVFTFGISYQSMRSLDTKLAEHIAKDTIEKLEFQRRDVSTESTRRLEGKVDDLSREVRALSDQIGRINNR